MGTIDCTEFKECFSKWFLIISSLSSMQIPGPWETVIEAGRALGDDWKSKVANATYTVIRDQKSGKCITTAQEQPTRSLTSFSRQTEILCFLVSSLMLPVFKPGQHLETRCTHTVFPSWPFSVMFFHKYHYYFFF